jgi:hypothetical protein
MTACTERHSAAPSFGTGGEGRKGMTRKAQLS